MAAQGAFAFEAGEGFKPAASRSGAIIASSGATLERCAEFCALHWFELAAVSTNVTKRRGVQTNVWCTCGNSTSAAGPRLPGAACSAPPPAGGTFSAPNASCLSGNGSCPCGANTSQACGQRGVARVYRSTCTPTHGPGNYLCPLQGGKCKLLTSLSD